MKEFLQACAWLVVINSTALLSSDIVGDLGNLKFTEYDDSSIKVILLYDKNKQIDLSVSSYPLREHVPNLADSAKNQILHFDQSQQFKVFCEMLKLVHGREISDLNKEEELKQFLLKTAEYEFREGVKQAMKQFARQLDGEKSLEAARFFLGDDIEKIMTQYPDEKKFAVYQEKAATILASQYVDLRSVFTVKEKKDEFKKLPVSAIRAWVKSKLVMDSENSVWHFLMLWLLDNKEQRVRDVPELAKYLNFGNMRRHFLLDVVKNFGPLIDDANPEDRDKAIAYISDKRRKAEEKLLAPHRIDKFLYPERRILTTNNDEPVMIKCVFQNVKNWNDDGKYYSSPVLIHGYEFYFFLQRQQINGQQDYGMAGFLRCSGPIVPDKHYLPIAYSVTIQTPRHENRERKFSSMKVIFESPEKAIGGKLTIGDERWEDVVDGTSVLVNKDTITIIVSIKFLLTDEGCLSMAENEPSVLN